MKQTVLKSVLDGLTQWLLLGVQGVVTGYRRYLSPLLGRRCRFWPTCSAYAQEALQTHGLKCGLHLLFKRLLRCHPWHPGGLDPVPERCCADCGFHVVPKKQHTVCQVTSSQTLGSSLLKETLKNRL